MQKLLKISQQTLWQLVVKLTTTISGFIILGLISRTYGKSGVGDFTLALTYLTFFYTLSDFGFNAHVLGKLDSLEWRKLLGVRILWSLILTIIALGILAVLPTSFSLDFKLSTLFGSLIILFFALNLTSAALFQAKLRYDLDIVPTLLGVVSGVGLTYLFVNTQQPLYLIILGYVLAWFIHSTGTLLATLKFFRNLTPIFDLGYLKNLFNSTWPLAGTLVLNIIYFRVDAFILANGFSSVEVGIYNMSYQVFQTILVLPTFAMNAFYPMMLKARLQIKTAVVGFLACSLVVSLITYSLSPFVIQLIAGSGFEGSVESLRILSFGFPAFFMSALLWWILVSRKSYKSLLWIYAVGLGFNVLANLIFISQYSYLAASWITVVSEYLILFLQVVILARR